MAAATRKSGKRLAHGEAKPRILDAAEELFAMAGLEGVSFRDLAGAAGVSLSAIHYHYGSKHAVLAEIFERRARLLTDRRLDLLDAAMRNAGGRPALESILDAFLRPAFEVTRGDRNDMFNRLRARLALEQTAVTRDIMKRAFDENDLRFVAALQATLPDLDVEDIHWRFHFLVGAMIYTMSDSGQLEGLSGGICAARDTDIALRRMVQSFGEVFRGAGLLKSVRGAHVEAAQMRQLA